MRKKITEGTIEFSVDYNLDCEDFTITNGKDIDISEEISYTEVTNYIHGVVEKVKDFNPSEHRTEGTIELCGNNMVISYRSFNSPDWDDYDEVELDEVDIIPFVYNK